MAVGDMPAQLQTGHKRGWWLTNTSLQVDLAVKLGLPLLAPHPSIARHFSLKSGAKQLFRSAKVNVPPGVELDPRPPGPHCTSGLASSTPTPTPTPTPFSTNAQSYGEVASCLIWLF